MRLPWQQCFYRTELRRAVGSGAWERALPATCFLLGTQWGYHCPSPPSDNPLPSGPEPRPSRPHLTSLCSLPRGLGLAHSGVWDSFAKHVCAGTRTRMLEGPDSPLQAVSTMPAGVRRDPVHRAPEGPLQLDIWPFALGRTGPAQGPIATFLAPSSANIKNYVLWLHWCREEYNPH